MTTTTLADPTDPQDCPDCLALGHPCPWHEGWAAGWDDASRAVGALVLDHGRETGRAPA